MCFEILLKHVIENKLSDYITEWNFVTYLSLRFFFQFNFVDACYLIVVKILNNIILG